MNALICHTINLICGRKTAFSFVLIGFSSSAAPQPRFDYADLPLLPSGYQTIPYKINSAGVIVGSASRSNPQGTFPFIYSNGVFSTIPIPKDYGIALDINAAGDALLYAVVDPYTNPHYLLFNGRFNYDLTSAASAVLGGSFGGAYGAVGLNDKGEVAGIFIPRLDNSYRPCLLSGGIFRFLGSLSDGENGWARDINNLGQVIGIIGMPPQLPPTRPYGLPVIWDGAQTEYIGLLPGSFAGEGISINDRGEAIGLCYMADNSVRGFLYTGGTMLEISPLPGDFSSFPKDMNNFGDVVGYSEPSSRAFLYSDGIVNNLNKLVKPQQKWRYSTANSLNDNGEIVGSAIYEDNSSIHGFVLTPLNSWRKRHFR